MEIVQRTLDMQAKTLSPYATLAQHSRGRRREEEPCPVRTCFARDRDRILHSNSFRRLKHKTQVFIAPEGDHFRERMTHTLEVTQIARTIARGLLLNEDLTEAIALGHDLGHTPFGHTGERVLNALCKAGFRHNEQSLRVVDVLERDGKGLNLTFEVRDGILNHRTSLTPSTPEGHIVRLSDKIAYINHDIQDAERCGELSEDDLPRACVQLLGHSSSERIHTLVVDTITHSHEGEIRMSAPIAKAMADLRAFLFEKLYFGARARVQSQKAEGLLNILFTHYMETEHALPPLYEAIAQAEGRERAVADYIAGMSDQFATRTFTGLFVPTQWRGAQRL